MKHIESGPLLGETLISAGLDYYKPTMSQVQFEKHPDTEVTFQLKNRGSNKLGEIVTHEDVLARLSSFAVGWTAQETDELRSHARRDGTQLFTDTYLAEITEAKLPNISVAVDEEKELQIETTGVWSLTTFWETIVMSQLNELYFDRYIRANDIDVVELYNEGDRRLTEKIDKLKSRPDIKFADFGTRRRFSYRWHRHVLERLVTECPDNLIGTSNVQLAAEFDLMPIGTFAHEMPMVYAAIAEKNGDNPLNGHRKMLQDWQAYYDNNLSTALTDTFGSEYFFADFTPEQAQSWQSLRHDSGDPIQFGENAINFFEKLGIDPASKTIVFSDGLNIDTIIQLADHFKDRISIVFGWGTSLTNDLGLPANSIVMKATKADGVTTIKLSDDSGKHMGDEAKINRYLNHLAEMREEVCV